MGRQAILTVAAIVLLTAVVGCQPITPRDLKHMELSDFDFTGAIPAEYGRLVGVSSTEAFPGWAQLWFERPDSSIVTVFVNYQDGAVRGRVLEIPRS